MPAILSSLPRWLLAIVALGVLAGYAEQVNFKIGGCKPVTASVHLDAATESGESASVQDDHNCHCQCRFTTLAPGDTPASPVSFIRMVAAESPVWIDGALEAPCLNIDHPPQLV